MREIFIVLSFVMIFASYVFCSPTPLLMRVRMAVNVLNGKPVVYNTKFTELYGPLSIESNNAFVVDNYVVPWLNEDGSWMKDPIEHDIDKQVELEKKFKAVLDKEAPTKENV